MVFKDITINIRLKRVLAICFSVLYCAIVFPQQHFVRFQHFFGNTEVRAVARSSDYLWVGTSNGVFVANNGNWTNVSEITPELKSEGQIYSVSDMRNILPYGQKALLATDMVTACYDVLADTISEPLYYRSARLVADAMCNDGNIAYIYTRKSNSLYSYNFENGRLVLLKEFQSFAFNVQRMVMVPGGTHILLIDRSGLLYLCDLTALHISEISNLPGNASASVALFDTNGDLWIGADKGTVFQCRLNLNAKQVEQVKTYFVHAVGENRFTDIIDTRSYICLATGNSGISFISQPFGMVSNMDNAEIHSIKKLSSLGLGYFFGITEKSGAVSMRFSFVGTLSASSIYENYSLAGNSIISLEEEPDGNVIIGSNRGIDRFNVRFFRTKPVIRADFSDITSMVSLDDSYYLAVSKINGLVTINRRNGKIQEFYSPSLLGKVSNESLSNVRLAKSKDGLIYILNYGGVNFLYDRETGTAVRFSFDFSKEDEYVEPIEIDNPDYAYFHSKYSIYGLDKAEMSSCRIIKSENMIANAIPLRDSVFVYSDGTNIFEYNFIEDNRKQVFSLDVLGVDGLFIIGMAMDRSKNEMWVTTSKGNIIRLDILSGGYALFPNELYDRNHFIRYPLLSGSNGFLYFPGLSGILVVNPNGYKPSDNDSKQVSINSFKCDDDVIYLNGKNNRISLPQTYKVASCNFHVSNSDPLTSVRLHIVMKRGFIVVRDFYTSSLNFQLGNTSPGRYSLYASVLGTHGWGEMARLADIKLVRNPFLSIVAMLLYGSILLTIVVLLFVSLVQSIRKKNHTARPDYREMEQTMGAINHMICQLKIPLHTAKDPLKTAMEGVADNEELYHKLVNVYADVNQAGRIADCIMNTYFPDNKDEDIDIRSLELNGFIEKLILSFDVECKAKGVKIMFSPNNKVQSVNTDVKKLEKIVSFLIINSINNSSQGTVTVSTGIVSQSFARISVTDIPNTRLSFDWALSYAQPIADRLQGRLSTVDRPDGVTLHMLDIPINSMKQEGGAAGVVCNSASATFVNTKKMSLLLVDDQKDVLDYIAGEMEDKLQKVYTASDGVEALVCLEQNCPDIVVSDILMPDMNGFELCAAMKTNLKTSHIPFIAISSKTESMYQSTLNKLGPDDFIDKPFDINDFYQTIRFHIGKRIGVYEKYESGKISRLTAENTFSPADENFVSMLNGYIDNSQGGAVDMQGLEQHMGLSVKDIKDKIKALADTTLEKYIQNILESVSNEKK